LNPYGAHVNQSDLSNPPLVVGERSQPFEKLIPLHNTHNRVQSNQTSQESLTHMARLFGMVWGKVNVAKKNLFVFAILGFPHLQLR
jgi:hypothetical protein